MDTMTPSPAHVAALGLLLLALPAAGDEPQADRRLEFLRDAVAGLEPEGADAKTRDALAVAGKPLIRYNDPTRGGSKEDGTNLLLDAAIWRLGPATGRPTALVTVEIYESAGGGRVLAYEFLSLTDTKFALKHKTEKLRWDATGSALDLKNLPDAPKPAATAAARLAQMRQLVRRFTATEKIRSDTIECRLLTQPIDRYHSDADRIAEGAIFALANGTNPEVGIVLETDGAKWRYGVLRFTSAETGVALDGKTVAAFEHFNSRGRTDGPYHNGAVRLGAEK
jgi:hypothetical protein